MNCKNSIKHVYPYSSHQDMPLRTYVCLQDVIKASFSDTYYQVLLTIPHCTCLDKSLIYVTLQAYSMMTKKKNIFTVKSFQILKKKIEIHFKISIKRIPRSISSMSTHILPTTIYLSLSLSLSLSLFFNHVTVSLNNKLIEHSSLYSFLSKIYMFLIHMNKSTSLDFYFF